MGAAAAILVVVGAARIVPSSSNLSTTEDLDDQIGTPPDAAAAPNEMRVSGRPVFKYSVIAGGADNANELLLAAAGDPVVAEHYRGIDLTTLHPETVGEARMAYVSYRVGDNVYWTDHKIPIRAGETILTNGQTEIRGRCGNCISTEPMLPTLPDEPDDLQFDALMDGAPQIPGSSAPAGSGLPAPLALEPFAQVNGPFAFLADEPFPSAQGFGVPGTGAFPIGSPGGDGGHTVAGSETVVGGGGGNSSGDDNPRRDSDSPGGGSTPRGGSTPPGGGNSPGDGTTPPNGGNSPGGGTTPPVGGGNSSDGGTTPPSGGGNAPGGGPTTSDVPPGLPGTLGLPGGPGSDNPFGGGDNPLSPFGELNPPVVTQAPQEQPAVVPEPGTIFLLGSGAAGMIARHIRSKKR